MSYDLSALELALAAFATDRTPARIVKTLRLGGRSALDAKLRELDGWVAREIADEAKRLHAREIGVTLFGDDDFPSRLVIDGKPVAPLLFYWGNESLLGAGGIGMCGSRAVSELSTLR